MADGSLIFDTKIDLDGFNKDALKIKNMASAILKSFADLSETLADAFTPSSAGEASVQMEKLGGAIEDTADKIDDFDERWEKMKEMNPDQWGLKDTQDELESAAEAAGELADNMQKSSLPDRDYGTEIQDYFDSLNNQTEKTDENVNQFIARIKSLKGELDGIEKQGFYFGDDKYDEVYIKLRQVKIELSGYMSGLNESLEPLKEHTNEAERLKAELAEMKSQGLDFGNADFDKTYQEFERAKQELENYKRSLKEEATATVRIDVDSDSFEGKINTLKQKLEELKSQGATFGNADFDKTYQELARSRQALDDYRRGLEKADKGQKQISMSGTKTVKSLKKINQSALPLTRTLLKLSNMFKLMLLRKAFNAVVAGVKEGFNNLVQYSSSVNKSASELMSSFTRLKNSFATAFAPIFTAVAPALTYLINLLSRAVTIVGQFIAALTGAKTFTQAKKVQQDYAKSLSGTGKAAKQAGKDAAKAVMPFDELNVIADQKDASADAYTDVVPADMFEDVDIDPKVMDFMDRFKEKLEPTIKALNRLKEALKPFKTFVFNAAYDFYDLFLKPVGEWTIGTGLPKLIDIFANGLTQIKWEKIQSGLQDIWKALAPFTTKVGEGLLWFMENILMPLGVWVINEIVPRFLTLLTIAIQFLNDSIDIIRPAVQFLWEEFLEPIAVWTGGVILDVLDWLIERLKKIGDWISSNKENISEFITIVGILAGAFLGVQKGVTLAKTAFTIFQKAIPVVLGVIKTLAAFITSPIGIIAAIAGIVVAAGNGKAMIETLKNILGNLLGFIKNVFTGDWAAAWENVKGVFNGVFNGIIIIIESAVNLIIRGLNKLSFDVPDWLPGIGGAHFGFNLKEISLPRLAGGAVIPPNKEFMAVLGDQRHGTNIEAPLDTIKQGVAEVIVPAISSLADKIIDALQGSGGDGQPINIYFGDELFESFVYRAERNRNFRTGGIG